MTRLPNPAKVPANATTPSWTARASRAFGRRDFDAVRRRTAAEAPLHLAVGRPRQIAAEETAAAARRFRPPGQPARPRRWACRAAWPAVSAARSAARPRAARSGRAADRCRARARGAPARRAGPRPALLPAALRSAREVGAGVAPAPSACVFSSVERLLMRGDTVAIELGQRRDRPRRLTEMPEIGGRKDQPQIPRLAELVDLDQPRAQLRLGCPFARSAAPASARRSPPAPPRPSRRRRPAASSLPSGAGARSPASSARRAACVPAEARRSASRCSACNRSVARLASASVAARSGGWADRGRSRNAGRRAAAKTAIRKPTTPHQKIGFPSISLGIGTPKYFNTVGAISMMSVGPSARGRLEISTPAVCL